jgi:uncharacterized protein YegL
METQLRPGPEGEADEPDWGEQLLDGAEFVDNPEPRCPICLLLDRSSSMAGAPLDALHQGLEAFARELAQGPLARQRVEVAVVAFGGAVEVVQDFVTADKFAAPLLAAQGQTPLGTGLITALDLIEARKSVYRSHGVSYWRPWLVVLTDGMPQGEPWALTRDALQRLRDAEAARAVAAVVVGVAGANMKFLARIARRPPLALPELRFGELFTWLSASAARAVSSCADDQLPLPPPEWGTSADACSPVQRPGAADQPWRP